MRSKYFSRRMFACRCGCGGDTVDAELLQVLEEAIEYFGCLIIAINSGYRCAKHNREVGGRPNSQHLLGKAADIEVFGTLPSEVQEYFINKYPDRYGVGCYENFTHIDVRKERARW